MNYDEVGIASKLWSWIAKIGLMDGDEAFEGHKMEWETIKFLECVLWRWSVTFGLAQWYVMNVKQQYVEFMSTVNVLYAVLCSKRWEWIDLIFEVAILTLLEQADVNYGLKHVWYSMNDIL